MDVLETLRGVAARARETGERKGADTQVIVTETGIRFVALVKGGLVMSNREIPWNRVFEGADFEREAQDLVNETIAHSKKKSAEAASTSG